MAQKKNRLKTLFKIKISIIEIWLNLHSYGREESDILKHINWISIYNSEKTQYFGIVRENVEGFFLLCFVILISEWKRQDCVYRILQEKEWRGESWVKNMFPDIFGPLLQIVCCWS